MIREHGGVICMGMENILRSDNRSEQSGASVRQKRGGRPERKDEIKRGRRRERGWGGREVLDS